VPEEQERSPILPAHRAALPQPPCRTCTLHDVSLLSHLQFVYAKLVGTFPFNAFLAGFFCCVGTFVLTLALRMKASEAGGGVAEFGGYALAMCTLFLASVNYIG
jgi:hypothetical protein